MLKCLPRVVFLGILSAVMFIAGALVAMLRGWGSPVVYLDVVNNSGVQLRSVVIEYESCGQKNTLVGGDLPPRARSRFNFLACGEGGYKVRAHLANGTELVGNGGYVESGYRITEIVESGHIRSETRSMPY